MSDTHTVQQLFEQHLVETFTALYTAFQNGEELFLPLMPGAPMPWEWRAEILAAVPASVRESYDFYFQNVQQADWGNAYLFKTDVEAGFVYAVHVTTDGDDGWLELFSSAGERLGAARRYLELVAWVDDVAQLRGTTGEDDFRAFPPALADRHERTLWGR